MKTKTNKSIAMAMAKAATISINQVCEGVGEQINSQGKKGQSRKARQAPKGAAEPPRTINGMDLRMD